MQLPAGPFVRRASTPSEPRDIYATSSPPRPRVLGQIVKLSGVEHPYIVRAVEIVLVMVIPNLMRTPRQV